MLIRRALSTGSIAIIFSLSIIAPIFGQSSTREYAPKSGQPGKDVVWVPNPDVMVQKMLDGLYAAAEKGGEVRIE